MSLRVLIAGNWKMNGLAASVSELDALIASHGSHASHDVLLCPPATLVAAFAHQAADSVIAIGGQDCHTATSGAHTGDISAAMIADTGASHVIVGHSERRADHGESDDIVAAKLRAADAAGLTPILCVGESLSDREADRAVDVVLTQLAGSLPSLEGLSQEPVIAYEPVWAIGTGKVAGTDDIAEMHAAIRQSMSDRFGDVGARVRILYGGSVKPGNAADISAVPNVDGALVGGASLRAVDFAGIIDAWKTARK